MGIKLRSHQVFEVQPSQTNNKKHVQSCSTVPLVESKKFSSCGRIRPVTLPSGHSELWQSDHWGIVLLFCSSHTGLQVLAEVWRLEGALSFTALQGSLKLDLDASSNRKPISWTNFGGSLVTWILCEGRKLQTLFLQPSFEPVGMIVWYSKDRFCVEFHFKNIFPSGTRTELFWLWHKFPPLYFCWRTLLDFFWIASAFQSDLTSKIDSITTRLSLSSLLWYNCPYCWTSSSHLLHLGVSLSLSHSMYLTRSPCVSLYSSLTSVKLIRGSYSFSVWPSVNTTP